MNNEKQATREPYPVAEQRSARKRTGCAHCDAGRRIIYVPNDPDRLPWHDNGSPTLHPCVATISTKQ